METLSQRANRHFAGGGSPQIDWNPMTSPTVERRSRQNCPSLESSRRHSQCLRRATLACANNRRFEVTALLLMVSAGAIPCAKSEICVETDVNVFLCTKDMARARREAMKRNDEPVRFASNLDLGVEQRNDGEAHQQRKVSQHMKKVEEYFETIVLADRKYDGARDKW